MIRPLETHYLKARQPLLHHPLQLSLQLELFSDLPIPAPSTPPASAAPPRPAKPPTAQPPARPPASANKRQILLSDYWLEYSLLRSKRRTIGFLINEDGLKITAPRWVTVADVEQAI